MAPPTCSSLDKKRDFIYTKMRYMQSFSRQEHTSCVFCIVVQVLFKSVFCLKMHRNKKNSDFFFNFQHQHNKRKHNLETHPKAKATSFLNTRFIIQQVHVKDCDSVFQVKMQAHNPKQVILKTIACDFQPLKTIAFETQSKTHL